VARPGRPLVALNTYHRDGAARPRFHVPTGYVDAVRAVGGAIVLIPPGDEHPEELLDAVDALLLCGGGDIDPAFFGGRPHQAQYSVCAERDAFDLAAVRAALDRRLPLLAICRGMQILNVALGGDLHVHLPDVVGERVSHRVSQEEPTRHAVRLRPHSDLARLLGSDRLLVSSWHHQGVNRLGLGLEAVAWAEDGTVEALELAGRPEVLAVQWHPELEIDAGSPQLRLFEHLVECARGRRG
jgi:putative glutamine amidotransferase